MFLEVMLMFLEVMLMFLKVIQCSWRLFNKVVHFLDAIASPSTYPCQS